MKIKANIFGSGTMRSGGSLHNNLISSHKDIIIVHDNLHFFRHIYDNYKPINKISNLYKLAGELSIRLKFRSNLTIDKKLFFNSLLEAKPNNYSDVHAALLNVFLKEIGNKKIIGEYANGEFSKITTFLNFNPHNIAYHVFRDPRGMLMSWKRITFSKGYRYLNSIFNWIDAVDHAMFNEKKFGKKRFLILKFEDTHLNPEKTAKKICRFFKVKYDEEMIDTKKMKKKLNKEYNFINISAYTNKNVYGFSKERISTWKNHIEEWEHELVDYLCKTRMKKMGYKVKFNKYPQKGLKIMRADTLLKKRLAVFLKLNKGTDAKLNDPSNPKNWEAGETSGTKFIDSPDFIKYNKAIKKIHEESKKFK
tara:strand:+ start:2022 stop:3113 length:1092 start_codon:yes stop_codon:yes gene_type:complete